MECSQVRKILFEYVDLGFPADIRGKVEAHLAECQGCTAQLAVLQEQMQALKSLPRMHAPMDLLDRVRERVEKESFIQRILKYLSVVFDSGQFLKVAGAATAAVLIIASLHSVYRGPADRSSVQTVSPPAEATPSPPAPLQKGSSRMEEQASAKSVAPPIAAQPPSASMEIRRETITLALYAAEPSHEIEPRSSAAAERLDEKESLPARMTAMERVSRGKSAAEEKLAADRLTHPEDIEDERNIIVQDGVSEAKRLLALFGGKVISGAESGFEQSEDIEAEIPAENYLALLDRLRSLGDISITNDGAGIPAPGSTVLLTLKFRMNNQP